MFEHLITLFQIILLLIFLVIQLVLCIKYYNLEIRLFTLFIPVLVIFFIAIIALCLAFVIEKGSDITLAVIILGFIMVIPALVGDIIAWIIYGIYYLKNY